jgi:hypothetical protein
MDEKVKKQLVEHGTRLLERFHAAEEKQPRGFESISFRGQLCGFRGTIEVILGGQATREILEILREKNGIPHCGPVADDGKIYGMDSEAHMDL